MHDQSGISKAAYSDPKHLHAAIKAARGETRADVVIRNARFLDVFSGSFLSGDVAIFGGQIVGTMEHYEAKTIVDARGAYLVPGFIDAHTHIESSLMTPVRFQQAVLPCGTTSAIWDPHEIANVWGVEGIRWALRSSEALQLDIFVMVPSCVPSTSPELQLETSGAVLRATDIAEFREHPRVLGLAEMMNFPGLLFGDDEVLAKVDAYKNLRRDGHCPGLSGKDLNAYGVAGIHSCHESTTLDEAREKLRKGIHVLIREGSCAKDARVLLPLVDEYSSAVVGLCSDDRNPADIAAEGHISFIVDMALRSGQAPAAIFRAASFATARAYGLNDRGAIAPGYQADICLVRPRQGDDWTSGLAIDAVYKSGVQVDAAELAKTAAAMSGHTTGAARKNLHLPASQPRDFQVAAPAVVAASVQARVIGVRPGQILTDPLSATLAVNAGSVLASVEQDVLKIAVLERHHGSGRRSVAFVKGFGLRVGAIATSINHDSHNVIVVGANDAAMATAVNALRDIDGGIVVVGAQHQIESLRLPIGGLMTDVDPEVVKTSLLKLKALTRELGCTLHEPFLTLSFLALPVIPALKITDRGLVDVTQFKLVPVVSS